MKEVFENFGILSVLVAFSLLGVLSIFGKSSASSHETFKRCVDVGVEVSKCNEIAGFEKDI